MDKRYCIINLKAYEEVFDKNLPLFIDEVEKCVEYAQSLNVEIILCVNAYDLKDAVKFSSKVKIFSQHIDPFSFGSHTGHFPADVEIKIGAVGSLISHSEDYQSLESVISMFNYATDLHLQTCVCARDVDRLIELQKNGILGLIALEPPELIGGDISVTTANPEIIKEASDVVANNVILLVGAGIKNGNDVRKAIELGSKGILVASGVVKSKDPYSSLMDLLKGFE